MALDWLLLAAMGFTVDILYVLWFGASAKFYAWRAGFFGVAIYAIALFGTVEVVEDKLNCIPLFFGYFWGSYCGVKINERLAKKKDPKIGFHKRSE